MAATGSRSPVKPILYPPDPKKETFGTEDIANGVLYLASDESRCVTGAELVIDCGYMMH